MSNTNILYATGSCILIWDESTFPMLNHPF